MQSHDKESPLEVSPSLNHTEASKVPAKILSDEVVSASRNNVTGSRVLTRSVALALVLSIVSLLYLGASTVVREFETLSADQVMAAIAGAISVIIAALLSFIQNTNRQRQDLAIKEKTLELESSEAKRAREESERERQERERERQEREQERQERLEKDAKDRKLQEQRLDIEKKRLALTISDREIRTNVRGVRSAVIGGVIHIEYKGHQYITYSLLQEQLSGQHGRDAVDIAFDELKSEGVLRESRVTIAKEDESPTLKGFLFEIEHRR